ncbi:MAG: tetratricopeptide repeat protein [Bacteroidetes bacterium]|nr:tetratricopeptide repeat protein [Bacteroidota bacterium]
MQIKSLPNPMGIVLYSIIVFVIALLVFYPATQCSFTQWDDNYLVTENPLIRRLSFESLVKIFSTYSLNHYHPLVTLSYALEYKLFGLSAYHFHYTNILLHAINSFIVVFLAYTITKNIHVAFVVGLLFSVHPLRVESVVWIAERKDVLCAFFMFLSIIYYIRYREQQVVFFFLIALLFFVAALLSKAMAVTIPLVYILYDYYKVGKIEKSQFLQIIPLIAVSILFGVIAVLAQYSTGTMYKDPTLSVWKSMFLASYSYLFYCYKFFLPIHLSPVYPYPEIVGEEYPFVFWISPLILGMLGYWIYRYSRKEKVLLFGILFYCITLLPVAQLIPVGRMMVAERFSYVPLFGVMLLVVYYGYGVVKRINGSGARKIVGVVVVCVVCMFLIKQTQDYIPVWCSDISLWNRVVNDNPLYAEGYNNLAVSYAQAGMDSLAHRMFARAVELNPADEQIYYNRGLYYLQRQKYHEAIEDFTTVITIAPSNLFAYILRGDAYYEAGAYREALHDYTNVLSVVPRAVDIRVKRLQVFKKLGDSSALSAEVRFLDSIGVKLDSLFVR